MWVGGSAVGGPVGIGSVFVVNGNCLLLLVSTLRYICIYLVCVCSVQWIIGVCRYLLFWAFFFV